MITWLDYKICASIYGSAATGFAIETSDVDIAVCGVKISDKDALLTHMEKLSLELKATGLATEVNVIQTATVPVIKSVPSTYNLTYIGHGFGQNHARMERSNKQSGYYVRRFHRWGTTFYSLWSSLY